jgi:hypothetical protein
MQWRLLLHSTATVETTKLATASPNANMAMVSASLTDTTAASTMAPMTISKSANADHDDDDRKYRQLWKTNYAVEEVRMLIKAA